MAIPCSTKNIVPDLAQFNRYRDGAWGLAARVLTLPAAHGLCDLVQVTSCFCFSERAEVKVK